MALVTWSAYQEFYCEKNLFVTDRVAVIYYLFIYMQIYFLTCNLNKNLICVALTLKTNFNMWFKVVVLIFRWNPWPFCWNEYHDSYWISYLDAQHDFQTFILSEENYQQKEQNSKAVIKLYRYVSYEILGNAFRIYFQMDGRKPVQKNLFISAS